MNNFLILVLNGETKFEYEQGNPLAGIQRRFLDKMDADMDDGIKLEGQFISAPDSMQRVRFVSNHLVNSFLNKQEKMIALGCAYLTKVSPDLKEIRVDTRAEHDLIDLIFMDN